MLQPNGNFHTHVSKPILYYKAERIHADGQQPCPRYAHAACFIRDFLVIHGGRNDNIYSSLKNIGLNDMHLYDINLNTWLTVCIFN